MNSYIAAALAATVARGPAWLGQLSKAAPESQATITPTDTYQASEPMVLTLKGRGYATKTHHPGMQLGGRMR